MKDSVQINPHRISADIGGTFTDIAYLADDGTLSTIKLLSTPTNYADAVIDGVSQILAKLDLKFHQIDDILHGCTVATNAILEKKGARTALITTRGFRDVLELRRIRVPRLYDPLWSKPAPLVPRHLRFEIDERMAADGEVVLPLDEQSVRVAARKIRGARAEAIAVCLINSYVNPEHETRIGEILREELPELYLSLSVDVLPQIREYERTSTTVINSYVGPPVETYARSMVQQLKQSGFDGHLKIMQSSGGILDSASVLEKPAQIIECGPAAGVIGARHVGFQCGFKNLITFDMGGTTAKASIIEDGQLCTSEEYEVGSDLSTSNSLVNGGGYALRLPVIDISEVGAGGGSIVRVDNVGSIKVGPQSAGALPGPACYGNGGLEPTVTDANVVLGYLNPNALAGGSVPIDAEAARHAVDSNIAKPIGKDIHETAYGIHLLANANMMRAVKAVTTNRGRDPRDFAMLAFGGSGGVHAVSLARELVIPKVIIPVAGGVFSAVGLLFADLEISESKSFFSSLDELETDQVEITYADLSETIVDRLGSERCETSISRFADLRYAGQAFELTVQVPDGPLDEAALAILERDFNTEHEVRYGHCFQGQYSIEVVTLRAVGTIVPKRAENISGSDSLSEQPSQRMAYFGEIFGHLTADIIPRSGLDGVPRSGPIIIEEYEGTVVIPPDAAAFLDNSGNIIIELNLPHNLENQS